MNTRTAIVKIGGIPASDADALKSLAAEVRSLGSSDSDGALRIAIVHGGGADVSSLSKQLGIVPNFSDGIRMTSAAEMDVVDMVLCGLVNKRLVRAFSSLGIPAAGISGADGELFTGRTISDSEGRPSRTAHVSGVNSDIVVRLWAAGYVPIVASPGTDESGGAVNINADEAAFALGGELSAEAIVFLSDVPGVKGANGEVIVNLGLGDAEDLISQGIITGGMVAKLRSAAGAIAAGVTHIVIGSYEQPGDLVTLISGHGGTTIHGD